MTAAASDSNETAKRSFFTDISDVGLCPSTEVSYRINGIQVKKLIRDAGMAITQQAIATMRAR